jgi:hypothetical protein
MKAYDATVEIQAGPDAIWAILTDAPGYQAWDSGVERVDGRIAPGEKITVRSQANPGRAFPVKVTEFDPGRRMTWSGGMPLGLLKGVAPSPWPPGATAPPGSPCARSTPDRCCP